MILPRSALALAAALLLSPAAWAQGQASKDRQPGFGTLGSNKEPIKIDADRLDVFDRESRAVFTGNVVAVQGETTMKCTILTVSYEPRGGTGAATPQPASASQGASDSSIRKIDCKGPVTIVSKTQVATGDNATFDRISNKVLLTGNVTLSEGQNLTRGERLVYDLNTAIANVETAPGGRVRALLVPGSGSDAAQSPAKPAETKPPEAAKPSDPKAKRPATR